MKTIVLFVVFAIFSVSSFAQNDFSLKPMPKIDFNSGRLQSDITNLSFEHNKIQSDFKQYFSQKMETTPKYNNTVYKSNMPIAIPGNYKWNMPIAVPDSTINYAIREKRVELFKSIEKNRD